MMRCLRQENGSVLVMFLGVVAVLAILAIALITLQTNVQRATAKDRSRAKAFNVAEAGLDIGQQRLDLAWPSGDEGTPIAPLVTSDLASLKDASGEVFLDDSEYPDLAARVEFYDDDESDNGMMYIKSVASVGGKTAGIEVLVAKVPMDLRLPPGFVLYTEGPLSINGLGSDGDAVSSDAGMATVYRDPDEVSLSPDPATTGKLSPIEDDDTQSADSELTSIEVLFPSLNDLIEEAALAVPSRDYADEGAFQDAGGWATVTSTKPHLVVIEEGDLTIGQEQTSIWSTEEPGVLIVRNGNVVFSGQTQFYGLIYCESALTDAGTPNIYGAVIAPGGATLKGDRALVYSPTVLENLNRVVDAAVRIMPGTWQELRGLTPPAT